MDQFSEDIRVNINEGIMRDPWQTFTDNLNDINDSLDKADSLLRSFLDGKPIDPFPPSKLPTG